jgi:hypothetical protein
MRRGENCTQRFTVTFWHHDVKVVGKAEVAHVSSWFGLCSPPELEEAVSMTASAMTVDAIRRQDGRVISRSTLL